ncbi:MAG: trypsin-like peptidase domain-containing protein [Pseudomonadota bacterium]
MAISQGLEPVPRVLNVYFSGERKGIAVALARAAEGVDLALLRTAETFGDRTRLALSTRDVVLGDDVVVMGYPTGLTAILARAGPDVVDRLEDLSDLKATAIAARLAAADLVRPLASRGIVSQTTSEALVFDADTTQGGSGGPVLASDGEVLALTASILTSFGGSNIGVPAHEIASFLTKGGDAPAATPPEE